MVRLSRNYRGASMPGARLTTKSIIASAVVRSAGSRFSKRAAKSRAVDEVIELGEDEFAMYVMNQRSWKHDFARTTAIYTGRHR
jgi:hypothetical protein